MKRIHIHICVHALAESTAFYSALLGAAPTLEKADYARWMLDDPALNLAISTHGPAGVNHLGIQADSVAELAQLNARLSQAQLPCTDSGEVECCYARSDKVWTADPDDTPWEVFQTHADAPHFHPRASGCCTGATRACC